MLLRVITVHCSSTNRCEASQGQATYRLWGGFQLWTLASPTVSTVDPRVSPTPADRIEQHMLVIRHSIACKFRLAPPATVYFLGPEPPTVANLRVLASSREKQGTQAGTHDFPKHEKVVHSNIASINQSRFIFIVLFIRLHCHRLQRNLHFAPPPNFPSSFHIYHHPHTGRLPERESCMSALSCVFTPFRRTT